MNQAALVTGADRGLGFALTEGLLARGWLVFAGQYQAGWPQLDELKARFPDLLHTIPLDVSSTESIQAAAASVSADTDRLDLLINNAGIISSDYPRPIREHLDYEQMNRLYDVNSLGPLRVIQAFLPFLDAGLLKRLCFVSSEAGSITRTERTAWYGYTMSKAALNMAVRILFNDLRPQGYTFRLYHPGWIRSYMHGLKNDQGDLEPDQAAVPALDYFLNVTINEDLLMMRDWQGEEWPW